MYYSDNHCMYSGKHIKDFNYQDWVWYYREHGAVPELAKNLAKLKMENKE